MSNGKTEGRHLGRSRSGRTFVICAVITLAAAWGTLFLVFREWRAQHRQIAAFGATEVAPLVDPLAQLVPPKVDATRWCKAVAATHGMLDVATGSGTIDKRGMETLHDGLRKRFAKTTANTAIGDLTEIWDDMEKQVGPILQGQPTRPPFCPPRPVLLGGKGQSDTP